jgi:hypothetical protein
MRVKNLNQAAGPKCSSGSWLALWERVCGQNAFLCFVKDCINRPSTGGLVQKDNATDGDWYVVPLCRHCSEKTGQDLEIWDEARLVSAGQARIPPAAADTRPVRAFRTAESLR